MYLHRFIGNSRWLLAAAIIFGFASQAHAVCYVNPNATGLNNGELMDGRMDKSPIGAARSFVRGNLGVQRCLINPR